MRAAAVMTKHVQTIPTDAPAPDAWELRRRKGIHHLFVMADSRLSESERA